MIKYILSLILLSGCATAYPDALSPSEISHEVPRLTEVNYKGVLISCNQQEVNSALVWQECTFSNDEARQPSSVCVRLQYLDTNEASVAVSREICSGVLEPHQGSVRHIAFTKKDRKNLDVSCGPDLKRCFTMFQVTNL